MLMARLSKQILLVWSLKRGISVTPKYVTEFHIKSNFDLDGLDLSEEEMNKLKSIPDRFKVRGNGCLERCLAARRKASTL